MRLPKSIYDSQKYLGWAFPILIAYGVSALVVSTTPAGFIGITVAFAIILTGWLSFGLIPEGVYNDLLLVCDVGLLSCYGLMVHFASYLREPISNADVAIWIVSGSIFAFYAFWDFVALWSRDTRALASAGHLRRFGIVCLVIAVIFFGGSAVVSDLLVDASHTTVLVSRLIILVVWIAILVWWHAGRVAAAIRDSGREQKSRKDT